MAYYFNNNFNNNSFNNNFNWNNNNCNLNNNNFNNNFNCNNNCNFNCNNFNNNCNFNYNNFNNNFNNNNFNNNFNNNMYPMQNLFNQFQSIKNSYQLQAFINQCKDCNQSNYPDYHNPNSPNYNNFLLKSTQDNIPFSGNGDIINIIFKTMRGNKHFKYFKKTDTIEYMTKKFLSDLGIGIGALDKIYFLYSAKNLGNIDKKKTLGEIGMDSASIVNVIDIGNVIGA